MHIIWTMIKVLGLILLWLLVILLSLVLLTVLAVVFAPVRYDIQGEGSTRDGTYSGKVTVWWMLHLVHGTASIEKKKRHFGIYVLGIPIHKILAGSRKKNEKKKKEAPAPREPAEEDAADGARSPESPGTTGPSGEEGSSEGPETAGLSEPFRDPGTEGHNSLYDRIRGGYERFRGAVSRMAGRVRSVYERTGSAKETAARYVRLWNEETTAAARKLLTGELRCLLKHWKPRRVEGTVVFGLGDPADTGFVLALLALFYPASRGRLAVTPDFEKMILEGRLHARGRMRVFWPLKSGIRLLLAPEIRATYQKWQTRKDG